MIANSLFHFTNYLNTLKLILESKSFRPSYNFENVKGLFDSVHYLLVPMVCFCDIPLKFIGEHSYRYGKYGIGLTKNWGRKNQINPILYRAVEEIDQVYSEIASNIQFLKIDLFKSSNTSINLNQISAFEAIQKNNLRLSFFMKGEMDGVKSNYIDREWRHVPKPAIHYFSTIIDEDKRHKINNSYFSKGPEFLNFSYNDIKHIVIPNNKTKKSLIRIIKALSIDEEEKYLMMQKVVDLESIKKDY